MRKQKPKWIRLLVIAGVALVTVAAMILVQNLSNGAPAVTTTSGVVEGPYPEVARIGLTEAKAALDSNSAVFVDVRNVEQYASRHIPGAVSIPSLELPDRLSELDPDAWIITYCT